MAKKKIKSWFAVEEHKRLELEKMRSGKDEVEKVEVKSATTGRKKQEKKNSVTIAPRGVPVIQGQTGLMYKISKCCRPKPGDKIKGYMTVNQGVSIHTAGCPNLKKAASRERRLLNVGWSIKKSA